MTSRAAKTASPDRGGTDIARGSVGPGTGVKSNIYWSRLDEAGSDKAELDALLDELEAHGYVGEVYQATLDAYASAGGRRRDRGSRRAGKGSASQES